MDRHREAAGTKQNKRVTEILPVKKQRGGKEYTHTHTPLGSDIMPFSFDHWLRRPQLV